jgi:hypothetical protein
MPAVEASMIPLLQLINFTVKAFAETAILKLRDFRTNLSSVRREVVRVGN